MGMGGGLLSVGGGGWRKTRLETGIATTEYLQQGGGVGRIPFLLLALQSHLSR